MICHQKSSTLVRILRTLHIWWVTREPILTIWRSVR